MVQLQTEREGGEGEREGGEGEREGGEGGREGGRGRERERGERKRERGERERERGERERERGERERERGGRGREREGREGERERGGEGERDGNTSKRHCSVQGNSSTFNGNYVMLLNIHPILKPIDCTLATQVPWTDIRELCPFLEAASVGCRETRTESRKMYTEFGTISGNSPFSTHESDLFASYATDRDYNYEAYCTPVT